MKAKFLVLSSFITLFATVLVLSLISILQNKDDSRKIPDGYSEITSVKGISFYINSSFCERATAVSRLSDDMNFQSNLYYCYKDGENNYLLFNKENLVVAAKKGTDFNLNTADNPEEKLKNASFLNIWFEKDGKKMDMEQSNEKTTTTVKASVSINATTYGDFCGKLVNVETDTDEFSLFVGVPGTKYDKLSSESRNGIEAIIDSISLKEETAEERPEYSYQVSNTAKELESASQAQESNLISSPYHMLTLNSPGRASVFNEETLHYENPTVCIKEVIKGKEAEKIIQDYCKINQDYEYFACPVGSSFEVAKYDINYEGCNNKDYLNIKIKGVDGEPLVYRGISYPQRTYDMDHEKVEEGEWVRNLYCYYPVPNGYEEYCLECGETNSVTGEEVSAAYYHILGFSIN